MSLEYRNDTLDHIFRVREYMLQATSNLWERARKHDASKLEEPEAAGFEALAEGLAEVEYGSDEYYARIAEHRPIVEHHYRNNDHHPEHFATGINGMSLFALVEMLCDWKAASERTKPKVEAVAGERSGESSSMLDSLAHNARRHGISPQLVDVLDKTIREMGWA